MLVDVITRTEKWLRQKGVDSPRLDTELILCKVLGMERLQLYLAHDRPMSQAELEDLRFFDHVGPAATAPPDRVVLGVEHRQVPALGALP